MKFIIGLGNPGIRYQKTRHNIGRSFAETLADSEKLTLRREKKISAMAAVMLWNGETVHLAYPEVFMNTSGDVIRKIKAHYPVNPELDLLIVLDDAALPFGGMRLRSRGSSGGHNGLKSIAAALGTDEFPRLRLGIGHPGNHSEASVDMEGSAGLLHDYVLDPFNSEEKKQMAELFQRAEKACRLWVEGPIERAMNVVNQVKTAG